LKAKVLNLKNPESSREEQELPAQQSSTGGSNYHPKHYIELNVLSPEPSPMG